MAGVVYYIKIYPYPLNNITITPPTGSGIISDKGTYYETDVLGVQTITVSADGYESQTVTVSEDMTITLTPIPQEISKLSNGTDTYIIRDDIAREAISNLSTVATSGSYNDLSNKPDLNVKADIDLSNITSEGKNIANWSTNVTNCITEIPQDIKLEFTGSNMILKAGSKVTFGDGTSITINVDKNIPFTITSADKYVVCYTKYSNSLTYNRLGSQTASGTTTPTSGYWMYYNTTDKKVYDINNGVNAGELSLPLCIFSSDTSSITSIDQVFNGFGYIGSTVFALPGVKGLIPNGRNEDGSLKNIEFTTENVLIRTFSANIKTVTYITSGGIYVSSQRVFDFEKNAYVENGSLVYQTELTKVTTDSNGQITLFKPKLSYRAVDYSDSSWLSGLGMPSSKYIDLTLGASGATYTAPANGYFFFEKQAGVVGNYYCSVYRTAPSFIRYAWFDTPSVNSDRIAVLCPVLKGDIIGIDYTITGETKYFRFIYAEGEN